MWSVALGIAVMLQAGPTPAAEGERANDQSAVGIECPAESPGDDCTAEETIVPAAPAPAMTPAAAAHVPAAAAPADAAATVNFRNDVGKKLRLIEAQFTMDGERLPIVLTSAEPGKRYVIVSGAVKPGPHVVSARLTYRGDRGVFSYMRGYKLNVRSEQVLTAPAGRTVAFTIVGSEAKGMTVPLEKRVVITVEDGR